MEACCNERRGVEAKKTPKYPTRPRLPIALHIQDQARMLRCPWTTCVSELSVHVDRSSKVIVNINLKIPIFLPLPPLLLLRLLFILSFLPHHYYIHNIYIYIYTHGTGLSLSPPNIRYPSFLPTSLLRLTTNNNETTHHVSHHRNLEPQHDGGRGQEGKVVVTTQQWRAARRGRLDESEGSQGEEEDPEPGGSEDLS